MILSSAFFKQLQQGLSELKPVYLFYGEEALFLRDCQDRLRHALQSRGYLYGERYEVDAGFDWQGLQMDTQAGSLFSEQRVIQLDMPKGAPGREGTQFLQEWANRNSPQNGAPPPEVILVIQCGKLDGRQVKSKWMQALESAGLVVQAKPVPSQALPGWCQQQAQRYQIQLDGEAAALLAERVEGNLLAADQELTKLSLLHPPGTLIDAKTIADSVVDQAHYQLFALATEMLKGQARQAQQILHRLRQEGLESAVILWLLAKEIRLQVDLARLSQSMPQGQAFKQMRVWSSRQAEVSAALQRHSVEEWQALLKLALEIDLMIKGIRPTVNPEETWQAISKLVGRIAA